jgi:hypothetical protein
MAGPQRPKEPQSLPREPHRKVYQRFIFLQLHKT